MSCSEPTVQLKLAGSRQTLALAFKQKLVTVELSYIIVLPDVRALAGVQPVATASDERAVDSPRERALPAIA